MEFSDVALRPLRESDAPAVLAAFLSSPDMARQGTVTSPTEAQQYVGRLLSSGTDRAFAVVDEDAVVGLVVVSIDEANKVGWVSYWMNASHRGRGWTKRAAATVADWALRDGGLERLELGHRANNPASGQVAIAAGFIQEGLERSRFLVDGQRVDVLTYGRLATDPWPDVVAMPMRLGQPGELAPSSGPAVGAALPGADRFQVIPAAYVYLTRGDQVLLQQRCGTGYLDGYWVAGVAGHVELHETAAACAVREASEELGVGIGESDLKPLTVMQRTDGTADPKEQRVDWFFSAANWTGEPRILEPSKCSAIAWCRLDELPALMPDYEREVLRALATGAPFLLSADGF